MHYQIKESVRVIHKDDGRFLVKTGNGRYFVVNEAVAQIVHLLIESSYDADSLSQALDLRHQLKVSASELETILSTQLSGKGLFKHEQDVDAKSIMWIKIPLITGVAIHWPTAIFKHAYHSLIVYPVLLITLLVVVYFMITEVLTRYSPKDFSMLITQYQGRDLVLIYMVMSLMMMVHELGHASALAFHNKRCKSIGFGMYWLFLAFYADVTEAWELKSSKRMMVDIGGVYFQMMLLTAFVVYFYVAELSAIHNIIIFVVFGNVIAIIFNLLPILKLDGYWLVSDFLEIENLGQKIQRTSQFYFLKYVLKKQTVDATSTIDFSLFSWTKIIFMASYFLLTLITITILIVYGLRIGSYYIMNFPELLITSVQGFKGFAAYPWWELLEQGFGLFIKALIFVSFMMLYFRLLRYIYKGILMLRK